MENILKTIFGGESNGNMHDAFIKFGKGVFKDRYLIEGRRQKELWAIKSGPEYANLLAWLCLKKAFGEVDIKGIIIYTGDFDESWLPIEKVKKFMGVKQYVINGKADAGRLIDVIEKYPRAFYALSFSAGRDVLKIKPKSPKNGKPKVNGENRPKCDFCALKTNDMAFIKELFFDCPDFKEVRINHEIEINDIELPEGETDPVKIREMSKRKGKIIRRIIKDGKEEIKEIRFVA